MPKCAKLLACILAFVLLLLITEAVFILENKASSLFQTGFPLSPKSLSAHWYSDWRYLDAGMNLSRSGIPVVDIAYVEPLRVFDDARARYTDILKGDWETRKRNLNELEKMLKASRTGRSVWEKVRSYYWDVDTQFALESAQRNLAGLTFAGRNASTEAVCEVCEWLVRTNGGELRMKSWDVKIDEIDPQALVEITRADFEPVLGSLQRQVQDVLNHVYQEEKAMERLLSNVKRMKQGYIWNPYLLRQRNWTDVIKPVVEQTMPNTTEGKRQRKVSLMAEHADIFEHRLQQAHGHLQHTVEELNRVRDAVRMMVGKLNKDYGVCSTYDGTEIKTDSTSRYIWQLAILKTISKRIPSMMSNRWRRRWEKPSKSLDVQKLRHPAGDVRLGEFLMVFGVSR